MVRGSQRRVAPTFSSAQNFSCDELMTASLRIDREGFGDLRRILSRHQTHSFQLKTAIRAVRARSAEFETVTARVRAT